MGRVSDKFKEDIKKYGRQIDVIITYKINEKEYLLDSDHIFSVTPTTKSNILKSAMKQLDFESTVKIPKGTIVNVQFGVYEGERCLTVEEVNEMKVSRLSDMQIKYLLGFEYINLGDYIIYEEPKYNADTFSYSYICYDKMLYSMKDYKKLNITYPITVREYINKICESIGLVFKNKNSTFANYNKQIKSDLYEGYDYKYRDILDELAQVTASTICINEEDNQLEIRYINKTNDIIDEDYLKDINVEFAEKYGPINSIVLSRSAESDNVYLRDENSVSTNGLCELKIIDNQIMNDNDRSDFLPDILEKLNGLNYYINDFNSTGITWLKLCDEYTVKISQSLFNCVLFNDEIKITQGLEETIYTDMPEISETDYTKSDKTDKKINKIYLIVDKQNQTITEIIQKTEENEQKLVEVEKNIDGITATVANNKEEINEALEKTRTELETKIQVSAEGVESNVSKTLESYSTTEETNQSISNAKTEAINSANTSTDSKLKNYSTTTQMNSAINQKADEISTSVSESYITKTDSATNISNAKSEAISTAGTNTDNKLKNYSTTTEMNSAITQKANEITSTVSATYSTKTDTTNAINNINIGGRNLFKNSNNISLTGSDYPNNSTRTAGKIVVTASAKFNAYSSAQSYLTKTVAELVSIIGKEYTFSVEIKTTNLTTNGVQIGFDFRKGSDIQVVNMNILPNKNGKWQKVSGTLKISRTDSTSALINIKSSETNLENVVIEYRNFKLEEGNKATDWTPAPEDATNYTDTKITTAKSEIKQTTDSISLEVEGKLDETKFTGGNIMLAINNDTSTAQINADKISLERKRN